MANAFLGFFCQRNHIINMKEVVPLCTALVPLHMEHYVQFWKFISRKIGGSLGSKTKMVCELEGLIHKKIELKVELG